MKYCEKCRAQLPDDARFCDNYGNNLLEKTSAKYSGKINAQVTAIHVNKKKLFPIVALLALVAIAFIAINIFKYMRTYPSKLEGIYVAEQMSQGGRSVYHIMNFGKDGSVIYTSQPKERTEDTYALYTSLSDETRHAGTYTAKKKKLTLNLDNGMTVYDYQMTDNGLELTDLKGETRIYLDATDGILGQQELKYTEAESLYAAGKYTDAMTIYESLDYYYDSGEKIEACIEAILNESIKDIAIEAESLEQVFDNQFMLRLKFTNGCMKELRSINYTMQIQDNESSVLAEFNTITNFVELVSGGSEEKKIKLTIADTEAAQRIAQVEANDLKLVFTISNVAFDGNSVTCENEVRELPILKKTASNSTNSNTSELGQTGMNTEDPAGIQEPTDINNAQLPEYTGIDRAYILPDSNTRYLSTSELQGFSAYELRIARNEIYARHGRMFTDPALNSYFRGKTWYVPAVDADKFNDNVLTDVEKTNLETIKKVETSKQ